MEETIELKLASILIVLLMVCSPIFGQATKITCYNKGIALAEQGKYNEAIEYFDSAITTDQQDPKIWYNKV